MDPFAEDAGDEPPVVDINALHRREWRRLELARRRRVARQRALGILAGLIIVGVGGYYALSFIGDQAPEPSAQVQDSQNTPAPVRVQLDPVPDTPIVSSAAPSGAAPAAGAASGSGAASPAGGSDSVTPGPTPDDPGSLADQERAANGQSATATRPGKKPLVWIQAGHTSPREPGYSAQTGAGAGAFGNEIAFTSNLAPKVIAKLKAAGVDARFTPSLVTPLRAPGAAFVSLHYDTPEGHSVIGYAIPGVNENYYHGEGTGTASPVPYSDSGRHRPATTVSAQVSSRSRDLANRLSTRYRAIFTPANGARSTYGGVQTPQSNPRVMRFYGFYRTTADARVLIECGAGVTDDAFLSKTDLLAAAISRGIVDHLRSRGLLAR